MDHAIPPSPAPSVRERSPAGLNQFPQHEDIASQPRCTSTPFDVVQLVSRSASRYQTPESQDTNQNFGLGMAYTQPHQGLPFHYPTLQPTDDASAYEIGHATAGPQLYNLNTPEASPPTAPQQLSNSPSAQGMAGSQRATQGMKALAVKSGRIEKASPPKKKAASMSASPPATRKEKSAKVNSGDTNAIDQPLSILTKDWDIPFVDIEAYVCRSADERREEVDRGKVPGKVKRAMNAFMLYRKAYQDRAKKWAQQSNHQVVSKVCGRSWSIEPDSVRRQFNDWAVIERDNHRKAHPEYKFTPSKPRKKGKDEFDDDSDLDDADWENSGRRDAKYRSASRTPMVDPQGAPYAYPYAAAHVADVQPYPPYQLRTTQHLPNIARNTSVPYDTEEFVSSGMHYRQVPTGHQHQLENIAYVNAAQQNIGLAATHHLAGPQNFDLGRQYPPHASGIASQPLGGAASHAPSHGHPAVGMGQQIDPSLMSRDGISQYDLSNPVLAAGSLGENQWQSSLPVGADTNELYSGPYLAEVEESYIQDSHLQYLHGDDESWKVDPVNEAEDWQPLE